MLKSFKGKRDQVSLMTGAQSFIGVFGTLVLQLDLMHPVTNPSTAIVL